MDSNAQGHLGCGESVENPAGWWSAPANDKASTGLYDDEVTFYPDGKYVYKGRSSYSSDIIMTYDGKYLYKGRSNYSSDIIATTEGHLPIALILAVM
jgi:hypothetical protein